MKQSMLKLIAILSLCLFSLILSAQETDIYRLVLKETIRPNLSMNLSLDFSDSVFWKKPIRLDAIRQYIPNFGFNYRQNLLLLTYRNDSVPLKVSPYLTTPYSNHKKYDPADMETTGDVIANVVLDPLASIVMINPIEFLNFLMRCGVLPSDPVVPKKSRKERMLKTITQDVYHIDDIK